MPTITTYNLAPVPRWLFTDLTGKVLSDGTMYTYEDLDHSMTKVAYKDPDGATPWTNPVPFEINGMPNGALYWASDSNYYLAVFDRLDVPQFTVSKYNAPFADQINAAPEFVTNYVRNPQFYFWSNSTNYPNIGFSQDNLDYVADDWVYFRNNNNATINISRVLFNAGQTDVPFNPVGYFHYECDNAGAGGLTYNAWAQTYASVQTLAGQEITVGFYAKSAELSSLGVSFWQDFGTGGSPEVQTLALSIPALTNTWQQYSVTLTLPNIIGKTIGTSGDDFLKFEFDLPLNQTAEVDICNVQIQLGSELSDFPYQTLNAQARFLDYYAQGIALTGDFKFSLRAGPDDGWVVCNDSTIGSQLSGSTDSGIYTKALFTLLWGQVSNTYAPILNSDGSPGTRGASAEADYNANKRLTLTRTLGRVLAQFNTGLGLPMGFYNGAFTTTLTAGNIPLLPVEFPIPVTNPPGPGDNGINTHVAAGQGDGSDWDTSGGGANRARYQQATVGTSSPTAVSVTQPTVFVNCMIKL